MQNLAGNSIMAAADRDRYKCSFCGRFLFEGRLAPGTFISVKCTHSRCREMSDFVVPKQVEEEASELNN